MANKGSSRRWLKEHFSDPYVKQAHQMGLRSRSVFKLQEIAEREKLFKPGMHVIDLGAAPGGWSEYIASLIRPKGKLIAVDLLPIKPIKDVIFIQGDFSEDKTVTTLLDLLSGEKVDWVVSDIAPNLSGNESIDIPRAMYLSELVVEFALRTLSTEGGLLLKVFQGSGFDSLLNEIKGNFKKVLIKKPKASRGRSREIYILARSLKTGSRD